MNRLQYSEGTLAHTRFVSGRRPVKKEVLDSKLLNLLDWNLFLTLMVNRRQLGNMHVQRASICLLERLCAAIWLAESRSFPIQVANLMNFVRKQETRRKLVQTVYCDKQDVFLRRQSAREKAEGGQSREHSPKHLQRTIRAFTLNVTCTCPVIPEPFLIND